MATLNKNAKVINTFSILFNNVYIKASYFSQIGVSNVKKNFVFSFFVDQTWRYLLFSKHSYTTPGLAAIGDFFFKK